MAIYAIGDVQGCGKTLCRLLKQIRFDEDRDRLWFCGDLVNRGPRSLKVLRLVRSLGGAATVVLGNHDLHLLAAAEGWRKIKPRDTLTQVLEADDAAELLDWLRRQPLLHREKSFVLVHAGLVASWKTKTAARVAREVERAIRNRAFRGAVTALNGDAEARWDDGLEGDRRLAIALAALTRMRTCRRDGTMLLDYSGPPEEAPKGSLPWFDVPGRESASRTIVCGHWAALGLRNEPRLVALDTGCVWGGQLTAVRLKDRAVFQEPAAD